MIDSITMALNEALERLKEQENSRENAIAITKIQEAIMWWQEGQRTQVTRVTNI